MNPTEFLTNAVGEEASEVAIAASRLAQVAAKANRFGLTDVKPSSGISNLQMLIAEYNDLTAMMLMLKAEVEEAGGVFEGMADPFAIQAKQDKFLHWSKRSVINGALVLDATPPVRAG